MSRQTARPSSRRSSTVQRPLVYRSLGCLMFELVKEFFFLQLLQQAQVEKGLWICARFLDLIEHRLDLVNRWERPRLNKLHCIAITLIEDLGVGNANIFPQNIDRKLLLLSNCVDSLDFATKKIKHSRALALNEIPGGGEPCGRLLE